MNRNAAPPLALTTFAVVLLTVLWGYLRLVLFRDIELPLTFVVPLLICVWTRRRWQLWGMAVMFAVVAVVDIGLLLPADAMNAAERGASLSVTLFNIVAGAVIVQLIIQLRTRLDDRNAVLTAQRAELEAQKRREENASLTYSAVKYERLPSIAAFGDYGSLGTGFSSSLPTRTYGVGLRIPIFDGGRRDARRGEALSQLRQERIRTQDLKEQVVLEIKLALDSLRSAESQVKTAESGLQLAEGELEQAERRYKAGVASGIEVTDAQTRLTRARENRISALFNHNLARIDLGAAMGTVERIVQ